MQPNDVPNSDASQWVAVGRLAQVGESVGGMVVQKIELHPEYERYVLGWEGGSVVAELTSVMPGHEGLCVVAGVTLFPRPELGNGDQNSFDWSGGMQELCARLAVHPMTVAARQGEGRVSAVLPLAWVGQGIVLLLLLNGLWFRSYARFFVTALMWAGLAGALRWAWVEPGIFNGGGAGWEKLAIGMGLVQNSIYGGGWAVLSWPMRAWLGAVPEAVFTTNWIVSSLTVGLLWGLARIEIGAVGATAVGGLAMLLPVPLFLARTEEMSVLTLGLASLAWVCAAAFRRTGGWFLPALGALALGLAVHTRPEALIFVPVVGVWALPMGWDGRRALALLSGVGILGYLLYLHGPLGGQQDVLRPEAFTFQTLIELWRPMTTQQALQTAQLALALPFTPWFVPILGVLGLVVGRDRWRLLGGWALLTLPFALKFQPLTDGIRLQAPALVIWILAIGWAAAWAVRWCGPWAAAGVVMMAAVTTHPLPNWIHRAEGDWLLDVVPSLPATKVYYIDPGHRADKLRAVMETLGPARWSGGGEPQAGEILYRGLQCVLPEGQACRQLFARCSVHPLSEVRLPSFSDVDLVIAEDPVTLGFYTVDECGP